MGGESSRDERKPHGHDHPRFMQRRRERHHAKLQPEAQSSKKENPVRVVHVPRTSKHKDYTYFEQDYTDTAQSGSWSNLLARIDQENGHVIGVIDEGTIRWSADAPNHATLSHDKDPKDFIRIDIYVGGKGTINVTKNYATDEELFEAVRYLQRSLHDHDDFLLRVADLKAKGAAQYLGRFGDFK